MKKMTLIVCIAGVLFLEQPCFAMKSYSEIFPQILSKATDSKKLTGRLVITSAEKLTDGMVFGVTDGYGTEQYLKKPFDSGRVFVTGYSETEVMPKAKFQKLVTQQTKLGGWFDHPGFVSFNYDKDQDAYLVNSLDEKGKSVIRVIK